MGKIIFKRLLQTIPTLLVVVTITLFLTRMLPGDPTVAILGIEAEPEDIEAMRAEMNLDKSLPVMGMGGWSKGVGDVVSHMILPAFCLATIPMATFARTPRSSMIDIMGSDYIRCLKARGIRRVKVIMIHALKNALPPLITVLGLQIAGIFTGAIITEGIFSWPGMGTMINTGINNRDYALIQGTVLFSAIMFVFCNMLVDVAYALLNPKVKLEKG